MQVKAKKKKALHYKITTHEKEFKNKKKKKKKGWIGLLI
jgi:hypothetical protein